MPSQLQQIQNEILQRFKRPQPSDKGKMLGVRRGALPQPVGAPTGGMPLPQPIDAPTGGVALGQQRSVFAPPQQSQQPQPNDQVLTPTNQAAITRPRSVFAPPQSIPQQASTLSPTQQPNVFAPPQANDAQPDPNAPFGSSGEPFGVGRDRRTQPRDYIADDTAYLRDLNAQPRGKKDVAVDVLRALNSSLGSNPKAFTPTTRERQIGETEQRIGQGLEIQKAQTQIANASMVPVQTADGRTIMIPRAKVGDWESKQRTADQNQQKIDATATKPKYTKDAQGRVIKITPQPGGEDKVETISKVVKTKVPHTVWADGQLKLWNPETGQFDNAKDTNDKEVTDTIRTPVKVEIAGKTFTVSPNTAAMATATGERFAITEDRAERGEVRQDTRDAQGRAAKAAELVAQVEGARTAMATLKDKIAKDPGDEKSQRDYEKYRLAGVVAAKELNDGYGDLYKAGEGSEGTPYYEAIGGGAQPTQATGGQGGSFNMKGWIADHPDATTAEKRAMRAKAKARGMSIVE